MTAQIPLLPPKAVDWSFNPRIGTIAIRFALPFYKGARGLYTHRLRSGSAHYWDGRLSHVSYHFWCGNIATSGKGTLLPKIPEGGIVCATCEGRAVGAGLAGSRTINGQAVMFSPRKKTRR